MKSIKIGTVDVQIDPKTNFLRLTDMAALRGNANRNIGNWMKNTQTLRFFESWERVTSGDEEVVNFQAIYDANRDQAFNISAKTLIDIGCKGIEARRGRYGGTYCHFDWAIHFANWFDPEFYVYTIQSFRKYNILLHGQDFVGHAFARKLAAKSYGLVTEGNNKLKLPSPPSHMTANVKTGDKKSPIKRHLNQVEADILNVAMWGMTARMWRTKFPPTKKRANMRDFATTEELETLSSIQAILRQMQADQYSEKEKLQHLQGEARKILEMYCDTPEKRKKLLQVRKQRGWK